MTLTTRQPGQPIDAPADDYLIEGHGEDAPPTVALRVVWGLQILLIVVLAAISFAVFWLVGEMLHLF